MNTQDLNDIYYAINSLEGAQGIIKDIAKTNSNAYEWACNLNHIIKNARKAYDKIKRD